MATPVFDQLIVASANPKKSRELHRLLTASDVLASIAVLPRPDTVPEVDEDQPDFLGNARLKAAAIAEATGQPAVADDSGLVVPRLNGEPGVRSARYCLEPESDAFWVVEHPQVESWVAREEFVATVGHDSVNIDRLLWELNNKQAHSNEDRRASFVTTVVVQFPERFVEHGFPPEIVTTGEVSGHITHERHGTDGFGYDPVFIPDLTTDTAAAGLSPALSPTLALSPALSSDLRTELAGKTFAELSSEQKALLSHRGHALRALIVELEMLLKRS